MNWQAQYAHMLARLLFIPCECKYPIGIKHSTNNRQWRAGDTHCIRCGLLVDNQVQGATA